jgi:hypothetical protein
LRLDSSGKGKELDVSMKISRTSTGSPWCKGAMAGGRRAPHSQHPRTHISFGFLDDPRTSGRDLIFDDAADDRMLPSAFKNVRFQCGKSGKSGHMRSPVCPYV